MLLIGCLLAANILPFMQAYRTDHLRHPSSGIPRVIVGWGITIVAVIAALFLLKLAGQVSRLWLGAWFLTGAAALAAVRLAVSWALQRGDWAQAMVRRVAVVGAGDRLPFVITPAWPDRPGAAGRGRARSRRHAA